MILHELLYHILRDIYTMLREMFNKNIIYEKIATSLQEESYKCKHQTK